MFQCIFPVLGVFDHSFDTPHVDGMLLNLFDDFFNLSFFCDLISVCFTL
jgi:hypothetical protein